MAITLLHTADWQIGKPFTQIPGDAGAALRLQRLKTVEAIAELAARRRVDAVLVAGDLFDDNAVSDETLRRTINALRPYTGPWVLLPGNHDPALAQSVWRRLRRLHPPDNLILADQPRPIPLCDGRLEVLPAPLQRRHDLLDLTQWFDRHASEAGVLRVGLAHGALTHRLPEGSEALNPIAEDRAQRARLDYLALGDWHGTLEIAPRTWYAGTPESDRFKTNDSGNLLEVTLDAPGAPPRVNKIPIGRYRWHSLEATLVDDQTLALLDDRLEELGSPADTLVRLVLEGNLTLAGRAALEERLAHWRARLHYLALDDDRLTVVPTDADLDGLEATGFVRQAVEKLRLMAGDPHHEQREEAVLALRILYMEQHGSAP